MRIEDRGDESEADVAQPDNERPARRSGQRGQRGQRVPMRRIVSLMRPYLGRLVIAGLLLIISSGLGLLFPLIIRSLLNSILAGKDGALLNTVVLLLFGVFIAQALVGAVQGYLVSSTGERVSFDLRTLLFRHLQMLPLSFYDHRRTGELTSRVTNDVTLLQGSLTNNILPIAAEVVTLIGAIAITATINWRFTLLALVVAPAGGVLSFFLGRRIRESTRGVQRGLGDAGVVLEEALSAPRIVQAFGREDYEIGRFTTRMRETLRQALRRAVAQSLLGPLAGFIGFSAVVLVVWFGGREVLANRLTAGDLIAFIFYLFIVIGPVLALAGLYSQIQAALAAAERIFELLDEPVAPALSARGLPPMPSIEGRVIFEHVSFAYPTAPPDPATNTGEEPATTPATSTARPPVLRDLSFEAPPGQVVALVGPSGAGKTTTLSLLLRLYEIDAGVIRVDGRDIRTVDVHSLRAQMALVPQEPVLFGDSIAQNIRYGRLDATDEQVLAAAAAANALGFIEQLPDGIQSIVGERGVTLSAGQRQRVAIARALLHDPRILLLDEATAALDNESEALVQDALARLMRGRTTLVVAHRLTTVERADLILVLDHGEIIERGTHDELLARDGLYARLYTRNFDDVEDLAGEAAARLRRVNGTE